MYRTDFLAVAHSAPTDPAELSGFLASPALTSLDETNQAAFAGIVRALAQKFSPEQYPEAWADHAGEMLTQADRIVLRSGASLAEIFGESTNDALLARWAILGDIDSLAELVRRAMNRDGSNQADQLGADAVALIAEGADMDPALAVALGENNFSMAALRFGAYPPGSVSLPLPVRAGTAPAPAKAAVTATASAPAAAPAVDLRSNTPPPVSPVLAAPLPAGVRAAGNNASADHESGTVRLGGATLSISAAVRVRDSITTAVVELLRPAEGFQWVDDTHDPQSRAILVDLDGARAKAAGLEEVGGGFLQAEVIQVPSRGPDPNAGKYLGRLYGAGGFTEFQTGSDDMNAAKFAVAERVRQSLTAR
jgi:hypothetical protein